MAVPERWSLTHEGHVHDVEIADAGLRRRVGWRVDGEEVAVRRTGDERVVLDGGTHGALGVRLPAFVGPARRVTWHPPQSDTELGAVASAHAGLGGLDLEPEPGSKAARREAWIRAHPHRYAARRAGAAAAGMLLPILAVWLFSQVDVPWPHLAIPWPDWHLPTIPWPDIPWPHIPWPHLAIPWPDWDLPRLPEWLRELLEKARYLWPVLLAAGLAHAEVRRRRRQDEARRRYTPARPAPHEGPRKSPGEAPFPPPDRSRR